jgi:serine/threonine-protein kinase
MSVHEKPPVAEGEVLAGKYRVERVLGVGGMGIVVAATHLDLDQRVAIKFLLPSAMENEEAVSRFQREARAASRLKSAHVAKVIDVGKLDDGAPYMVMEYLEGLDLGRLVGELKQLTVEDAVWFVVQACEAIAEAHGLGIVHRDIKPQNLFVTKRVDGRPLVKVLDFGISKSLDTGSAMSLTRTTSVMGSPLYMSPEQMRSAKNIDARSDIWALGVILYELLTGRVPFEAEAVPELCLKVVQDPATPPHELRPEIPEELSQVVLKCLEKSPEERFQTVAELVAALEPFCPESERGAAERISHVLRTAGAAAPTPAADIVGSPKVKTNVTWEGDSQGQEKGARRKRIVFGGIAATAVVAAIVIAVKFAQSGAQATPAASGATATTTAPAATTGPASVTAPATSPAPVSASAPAPATTTAPIRGIATNVAKPPGSATKSAQSATKPAQKDGGTAAPAVTAPPKGFDD